MKRTILIAAGLLLGGLAGSAQAQLSSRTILHRDTAFEEKIRLAANPDTTITPAKVLRWVRGLMGMPQIGKPSNWEFQPVVRSNDTQQQYLAQFAYKF